MKKKTTSNRSRAVKVAVVGAGIAALAATAYFLLGPKGKKHQKQAEVWAINMKRDVVKKLEKARAISEPVYNGIIDSVAAEYEKKTKASRPEIQALAADFKKHWKAISGLARDTTRDVQKTVLKVSKKAKQ